MKQIILDTNLLVLLIIGLTDPKLIETSKRTRSCFEKEDFTLLTNILSNYNPILVTPHILTETSNLISHLNEPKKTTARKKLSSLLTSLEEEFETSLTVTSHKSYLRLGLADCAILNLISNDISLITTDLDLYLTALKINNNAINFNHLRQKRLLTT